MYRIQEPALNEDIVTAGDRQSCSVIASRFSLGCYSTYERIQEDLGQPKLATLESNEELHHRPLLTARR